MSWRDGRIFVGCTLTWVTWPLAARLASRNNIRVIICIPFYCILRRRLSLEGWMILWVCEWTEDDMGVCIVISKPRFYRHSILTAVHSRTSTNDATSTLHAISWCRLQISSRFKPCNMPTTGTVRIYGGVRLFKSSCASPDASPTSFCSSLHASYSTYATLHSNPDSNSWQSTLQRRPNISQSDAVAKDLCSRAFSPGQSPFCKAHYILHQPSHCLLGTMG
jgi:hypothetical protein